MKATVKKKVEYDIKEKIGVVTTYSEDKASLEFNIVQWGEKEPKYDLRRWLKKSNGVEIGKGITLTLDELKILQGIINRYLEHMN